MKSQEKVPYLPIPLTSSFGFLIAAVETIRETLTHVGVLFFD